ncbi:hypothetical protein J6590_103172, partial [Homalodisca vitripennis]
MAWQSRSRNHHSGLSILPPPITRNRRAAPFRAVTTLFIPLLSSATNNVIVNRIEAAVAYLRDGERGANQLGPHT